MQVADPKPQPGLEIVRELRRLVALLGRRRHELDLLDEAPVPLRDAGLMVVLGEDALRSALQTRLSEASALLAADEDREDVDVQMEGLRKILEAPEWDTAALAVPALRDKRKQQEAIIQGLQDEADVCRQRIEPLRDAINSALEARAPVRTQLAALMRMEALVGQADRALGDKRYADVSEPLAQLRAATGDVHALIPAIEEKAANARRFNRQADVLLIRSPSEGRHMYTVLLRTPSEPGSHGINIQDSSCLVDEDREYVRDIIERVTRAVDAGTVRRFRDAPGSDDRATNGSQSTPDVTREWPVEPAAGATEPEDLAALIRDVGRVMFRLFMPDRMREYLGSTPCSITVTTNDLELPWELMQEGKLSSGAPVEAGESDGFLCLERPVARMPMGRAFPRTRLEQPPVKNKLRFLLIYADPGGTLPLAEREVTTIEDALKDRWTDEQIEIDVVAREAATGKRLNTALLNGTYDVIHFAGHARFDDNDPDMSGLLLHNREVFLSQKIQRFLEGRPLVFLNACQTGRTANEREPQRVEKYFWEPAEGLASAFLYGGALGCVGSLWPIYDEPAAAFAVTFYNQVLEGHMIGEAMRLARLASRKRYPDSITWAAFVLYGDPTFRLVR